MATDTSNATTAAIANPLSKETLQILQKYTACDISDALLKLKVPGAGFLPDLISYSTPERASGQESTPKRPFVHVAPASTVYFIWKDSSAESHPTGNIPQGQHWVDLTVPGTFVVEQQPAGQNNAVLGGIMASRMKQLNAAGIVVDGRIRDVGEIRDTGLTVWAKATSTVGTGAETKAHAVNIPITIAGVTVTPGDYVFSDSENGVVVIPKAKLDDVLAILPGLIEADDLVKSAVQGGMSVKDAFAKYRS